MSGTEDEGRRKRFEASIPFLAAAAALAVGSALWAITGSRLASESVALSTYVLATAVIGAFLRADSPGNMPSYMMGVAALFLIVSGPFLLASTGASGAMWIGTLAETIMRYVGIWLTSADGFLPLVFGIWACSFVLLGILGYLLGLAIHFPSRGG